MRAIGAAEPMPWEDELGRITATTDANGSFVLYAPPVAAGEAHSLQVTAAGYAAVSAAADSCTQAVPCALTMDYETTAAAPFNPPAGSYEGSVLVTLESTTVGATLRYTLDGTTPSAMPTCSQLLTRKKQAGVPGSAELYLARADGKSAPVVIQSCVCAPKPEEAQ